VCGEVADHGPGGQTRYADGVASPVVGFDLDMTLVDSRPGIAAAYRALSAETGVWIDVDAVVSRLGPPVEQEMARWFPPEQVAAMVARYRALYPDHAVAPSPALAGAAEAIAAVRDAGGKVVVISAKHPTLVRLHLDQLQLSVDEVVGLAFADGKTAAIRDHGVQIYVGDHTADVRAAQAAGITSVGVTTGPCDARELQQAGADVVLEDLQGFAGWLEEWVLTSRLDALQRRLQELDSLLVAFSGGADSAFLLAAAVRALGPERVVAATALSPSLPATELEAAQAFARQIGVRHELVATAEMERPGYRANGGDRCFHCKAELLDRLRPLAAKLGLAHVATGTNADDVIAGFRPGIRAAAQRGAVTPLCDVGLTKPQIRTASRRWGLVTWDKPAAACLASRIAYGVTITPSRLARVERAEAALRQRLAEAGIGVRNLRVRDLGDAGARVEVDADLVDAVAARPDILTDLEDFPRVTLDPRGFRSGSMNELLPDPERFR